MNIDDCDKEMWRAQDEIRRLQGVIKDSIQFAEDHAKFCKEEFQKGASRSLLERSKGAQYIADKITALDRPEPIVMFNPIKVDR